MKRLIYIALAFLVLSCKPSAYLGPLDSPVGNWEGYRGEYFFDGQKVAVLDSCEFKGISFYKQGYCCIEGVKGAFPFIYNDSNGNLQIDSTLWSVPTLTGAEMVMEFVDRIYPPEPEAENPGEGSKEGDNPNTENPEQGEGDGSEGDGSGDRDGSEGDGTGSGKGDGSEGDGPNDGDGSENGNGPNDGDGSGDRDGSEGDGTGSGEGDGSEGDGSDEPEVPTVKPDKNGVILPAEYKEFVIEANKNGYFYLNTSGKKVYCNFKGWKNEADSLIIDFWYDTYTNYLVPLEVEPAK